MKRVLVAYTTNAGSTEEVAQAVGATLSKGGALVDICRIEEVSSLASYQAVVVGAPMILGWHRNAVRFVKQHQKVLEKVPTAYFCTALSLTDTGQSPGGTPIWIDPELAKPPLKPGRMSIKERYATLQNYLRPIMRAAPVVKPASVAFFGGKLELFRLKWWQVLFVMVIIQAQPGDRRNWANIQAWAEHICADLLSPA